MLYFVYTTEVTEPPNKVFINYNKVFITVINNF